MYFLRILQSRLSIRIEELKAIFDSPVTTGNLGPYQTDVSLPIITCKTCDAVAIKLHDGVTVNSTNLCGYLQQARWDWLIGADFRGLFIVTLVWVFVFDCLVCL